MKTEAKKMNRKVVAVGISALVIGTAAVNAFFTDSNELVNTFTTGGVTSNVVEEKYDSTGEDQRTLIGPGKVMIKDPKVVNNDTLDMYTFLKVTVPTKNVVNMDKQTAAPGLESELQPLFTWEVNNGWTLIKSDVVGETTEMVYAYGTDKLMTPIAPGAETSVLFKNDQIKFINVIEDSGLANTSLNVVVKDYSIQTTDLNTANPTEIYNLILAEGR